MEWFLVKIHKQNWNLAAGLPARSPSLPSLLQQKVEACSSRNSAVYISLLHCRKAMLVFLFRNQFVSQLSMFVILSQFVLSFHSFQRLCQKFDFICYCANSARLVGMICLTFYHHSAIHFLNKLCLSK